MPRFFSNAPRNHQERAEDLVAEVFRRGGWKVREKSGVAGEADLIVAQAGTEYGVEIKRSSGGRKDRLIPLVSQAILQAQKIARSLTTYSVPVAVVVADYIPESVAQDVKQFARQHAPDVGVGVVDFDGLRSFEGHRLEYLNSKEPTTRKAILPGRRPPSPQLFSDLNQWMLKVLLAPGIPRKYLSAPRGQYQGASQLARAADVSVMSAFRFIEQFSKAGFLEDKQGSLRVVQTEELMPRWLAANQRSVSEIGVRRIPHSKINAPWDEIRTYVAAEKAQSDKYGSSAGQSNTVHPPRVCLALLAAAKALKLEFIDEAQPCLYLERIEPIILEKLGLSASNSDVDPDAYVRVPWNDKSVFRAVVLNNGVPTCDILQLWLDIAQHSSNGKEQADLIWRKILTPMFFQSEVDKFPDGDQTDDPAMLTIQESQEDDLANSIREALKLATRRGSYLTELDVLSYLNFENLSRASSHRLSSVSNILRRFTPREVETTMRGRARAFRWIAVSPKHILAAGRRKIRFED
jgi:Holliday junction resolvase-like predicted endonuclease